MAWRSGSLSRSLTSTASASLRRAPQSPLPRFRPPPLATPRFQSRRFSFAASRNLGCMQSLLPLHSTIASSCLTSHPAASVRACCELSHGT